MADSTMRDGRHAGAETRTSNDDATSRPGESSAFNFSGRQDSEGIPQLLSDLVQQGTHLAEQQTRLVEAEVRSAMTDVKESVAAMAGAAVLGIASIGVFLMAISFLLARVMPTWLGTLVVAVVSMGVAYAMYAAGQKKLQSRSMTLGRTRHTMERAPAAFSGNRNEARRGR
jgi:uncharacterized protein (DUF697 family)